MSLKPSKKVVSLSIIGTLSVLSLCTTPLIRWSYSIKEFKDELIAISKGDPHLKLPEKFTILVWNIYKTELFPTYPLPFSPYDYDFALLQEDKFPLNGTRHRSLRKKGWNYFWPAFQMKEALYGTSLFSKIEPNLIRGFNSDDTEPISNTPKSFIAADFGELRIINVHALNFVGFQSWKLQIVQIMELTHGKKYVIVAGDFNTSNKERYHYLTSQMEAAQLAEVVFNNDKRVIFNKLPVDYVFAKGLNLKSAEVMELPNLSDHNPMEVVFEKKPL